MPIISHTDHKTLKGRLVIIAIYASLIVGGLTMVCPFMVTLTGLLNNPFDYKRRDAMPRFFWSREDRFMRTLCTYFPPAHRASIRQLRQYFPDLPADWQIWSQIGDDRGRSDARAREQLRKIDDPATRKHLQAAAADYGEFMQHWYVRETVLAYDQLQVAPFLHERYKTLDRFNASWQFSVDDFYEVAASEWGGEPIDLPNYVPEEDARYRDLLLFREAYRKNRFTPYLGGKDAPASYLRPAALRFLGPYPGCPGGRLPESCPPMRNLRRDEVVELAEVRGNLWAWAVRPAHDRVAAGRHSRACVTLTDKHHRRILQPETDAGGRL